MRDTKLVSAAILITLFSLEIIYGNRALKE